MFAHIHAEILSIHQTKVVMRAPLIQTAAIQTVVLRMAGSASQPTPTTPQLTQPPSQTHPFAQPSVEMGSLSPHSRSAMQETGLTPPRPGAQKAVQTARTGTPAGSAQLAETTTILVMRKLHRTRHAMTIVGTRGIRLIRQRSVMMGILMLMMGVQRRVR